MNCDDCGIPISLPFPVTIYNQTFTSAIVGSNGTLSFGTAYDFAPTCMPVDAASYSIAPYWVDQFPVTSTCPTCGVFTAITGQAPPNRKFVVEWRNAYYPGNATPNLDYEVVLYETPPSPFSPNG